MEKYCCSQKCFRAPQEQVDGRACDICNSFNYCRCECDTYYETYMEYLNKKNDQLKKDIEGLKQQLEENRNKNRQQVEEYKIQYAKLTEQKEKYMKLFYSRSNKM